MNTGTLPRDVTINTFIANMTQRTPGTPARRTRRALAELPAMGTPVATTPNRMPAALSNNIPDSYLSPTPSPDEMIIRSRGRRRNPVTWSPDIDLKAKGVIPLSEQFTPVKDSTRNLMTMTLRSTPRKRLQLNDVVMNGYGTPDKNVKKMSPLSKKYRMERCDVLNAGPLGTVLKAYSQDQLISVIQDLVKNHPDQSAEEKLRCSLPQPDLQPMEDRLLLLKQNIYKSLPSSRLSSKTDSPAYSRASTHLTSFKKCVIEQGRILVDSQLWSSVIDYVCTAWLYVRSTPLWDNPPHNSIRRQCFKSLAGQSVTAIRRGQWTDEEKMSIRDRFTHFKTDSEEMVSCLKLLDKSISP